MRVVVAHGHIFKNAGTTFDWALRRSFGDDFCDHRDDHRMRKGKVEYLQGYLDKRPSIKAISSHHMCDSGGIKGIKVLPVFFLRHPILRALSVYNFEKVQRSIAPGAIAAKKYSFKDYIKWRMEPEIGRTIRDYQVAYLAGSHTYHPQKTINQDVFCKAIQRFEDGSMVGVVEDFDRSMALIEFKLKSYFPGLDLSYIRQNTNESINTSKSKVNYISDELGDVFDSLLLNNSFDFALYRLAKDNLDKMIQGIDSFSEYLRSFTERCSKLQHRKKKKAVI